MHPFIVGELALGSMAGRGAVLDALRLLPAAAVATDDEVLGFVDRHRLFGIGIGYVDAHLLAATVLSDGTRLWTRDRRLAEAAKRLGFAAYSAP